MNWKIERLERLEELRLKGALTQEEFEIEKAKVLSNAQTFDVKAVDTLQAAAEPDPTSLDVLSALSHYLSTVGTKRFLRLLAKLLVASVVILILIKFGLYIAIAVGVAAIGSHVYSNSTEDTRLMRFAQYGYVVAAVAMIINLSGGRLISNENHWLMPSGTDKFSADSDGESFADSDFSSGTNSEISCRSAMQVAAVATCGIRLLQWQAGNDLSGDSQSQLASRKGGYERSLYDARSLPNCSGPVTDGEAAAQRAFGDVDFQLVMENIESATSMCASLAQESMESSCAARPECE